MMESRSAVLSQSLTHTGSVCVIPDRGMAGKRIALYKKRNESPKFRDILRARCHARIRANRCALIEKFRNIEGNEEDLQNTLSGILREEVNVLISKPPITRDSFEDDLEEPPGIDDDAWLIREYEKILADEEATWSADWEEQVICPLCVKSVLRQGSPGAPPCCDNCHVLFPPVDSLRSLSSALDSVHATHAQMCDRDANFAILDNSELTGLFLICEYCFSFSQVV